MNEGLDGLLVTDILNVRYLTNFTGSNAILYVTKRDGFFITDFRYIEQAKKEISEGLEIIEESEPKKVLCNLVGRGDRVGFEPDRLSVERFKTLKRWLNCEFIPKKGIISSMREVKDEEEIAKIKEAVKIANSSFERIRSLLREGVSELEIAANLEYGMRMEGSEGMGFPSIVASGERSSLPHGRATKKRLKMGETVIIDWGAVYCGYHSDLTRTVFIGEVDSEIEKAYKTVLEALEYGLSLIRPGIEVRELDEKVRGLIRERGLGPYFGHNLGHGVGLDIHEEPEISSKNRCKLVSGMVFTIEPGIYLPGKGGVRVEEMVLVKDDGHEILSGALLRDELYIPS